MQKVLPITWVKSTSHKRTGLTRCEETLLISLNRPDFDEACRNARVLALASFKCDDNGYCHHCQHCEKIARGGFELIVEFKSYRQSSGMGGQNYTYTFSAYLEMHADF